MITVEDANSAVFRDGMNSYIHEIDTSLISDSSDFSDVVYDFVKVSRSTTTSQGSTTYHYTFEIQNKDWTGAYYLRYVTGGYIYNTGTYNSETGILTYNSNHPAVKLYLYCSALATSFNFKRLQYIPFEPFPTDLTLEELGTYTKALWNMGTNTETSQTALFNVTGPGVYSWTPSISEDINATLYYLARLKKTSFSFNCTQDLIIGKVNKVALGTGTKYKPSGALIGNYTPTITVEYKGESIPVTYDTDDYYFNLDLTDKTEPGKIKFTVIIENNEVLNYTETTVSLNADYELITTSVGLVNAFDIYGNSIIKLGADITLTNGNMPIKHDLKIIGNDKTLTCTGGRLWVNSGVHIIIEDCTFTNGKTCILQLPDTTVELTNCIFTENQGYANYNYSNNKGSCILCRNRYSNLEDENDFTTILRDCTFTNNHSAILHGGQLTIDNCRFHNTDLTYTDEDNPAFLYQTDGEANITNSVFDLDYTGTTYCSNEENIGYAQSLIICGENAVINGRGHEELQGDNSLPFFEAPYNNRSHLFVKYYYPQIEECVYSSPLLNYEDKSCCHSVSGLDWVFKDNVKITKASTGNENTDRRITW